MKLTMHDKKMLLILAGVMAFVLCYLFVYRPQMEEAQNIEDATVPLQTRLNDLMELASNKEFYVNETNTMQSEIQDYCNRFPALVRPEDGIVLAQNMEKSLDMSISNISLGSSELIWYLNQSDSSSSAPDQTMMEQLNDNTQSQLDEIEGTSQAENAEADSTTDGTNAAASTDSSGSTTYNPALYRIQDTFQFDCTYESLKDAVTYLASQAGRMTLDNVTASFDSSTGNLTGTMTVNLYFMTGVDNTYTQPDAGVVDYGTDNIFGSLTSASRLQYNLDTDGDGEMDAYDANGDGIPDDPATGEPLYNLDTDGDGINDAYDGNGDGLPDNTSAAPANNLDTDGDGIPDAYDADGDGVPDTTEPAAAETTAAETTQQ